MNMRRVFQTLALIAMVTLAVHATAQSGGGFDLSWNTIDGGGGSCSGGPAGGSKFALSGTTGQFDAGGCAAGAYPLQGGFLASFQNPAGPELKVTTSFGALIITWPAASCSGFHLEASARPSGGPWVDLGEGFPSGPDRFVAVAAASAQNFFRLRKACAGGCSPNCQN